MSDGKSFDDTITAIHEALGKAERLLSEIGDDLRFLVGPLGEMEIVRRGPKGATLRPKVVVARLPGCDPMLWRPEYLEAMSVLEPRPAAALPDDGGGQSAAEDSNADNGGPEPPASI